MDGLCRVLASPTPALLGGVFTLVRPLDLSGIGSIEAFLLSRRKSPLDHLLEALPQDREPTAGERLHWQALLNRARAELRKDKDARIVRLEEIQHWIDTPLGLAFTAWYCCGRDDPRFGRVDLAQQFFRDYPEDISIFKKTRDTVSGTDLLASFDFPEDFEFSPTTGKRIKRPRTKYQNWISFAVEILENVHKMPQEIGQLTLYHLQMLTTPKEQREMSAGGQRDVDIGGKQVDAKALARMSAEERKRYLASLPPQP